jgi:hypothetical protein
MLPRVLPEVLPRCSSSGVCSQCNVRIASLFTCELCSNEECDMSVACPHCETTFSAEQYLKTHLTARRLARATMHCVTLCEEGPFHSKCALTEHRRTCPRGSWVSMDLALLLRASATDVAAAAATTTTTSSITAIAAASVDAIDAHVVVHSPTAIVGQAVDGSSVRRAAVPSDEPVTNAADAAANGGVHDNAFQSGGDNDGGELAVNSTEEITAAAEVVARGVGCEAALETARKSAIKRHVDEAGESGTSVGEAAALDQGRKKQRASSVAAQQQHNEDHESVVADLSADALSSGCSSSTGQPSRGAC